MSFSTFNIAKLILRELFSPDVLKRKPEPSLEMTSEVSVNSFHAQGSTEGAQIPVYHFNALACSSLLPKNGLMLDLGSGSGQFLAYMARCRPDIKIIGLELSEQMVTLGRRYIKSENLEGIIELKIGDMTDIRHFVKEKIDLISSVFSFHHLPDKQTLEGCINEVSQVRAQFGTGIWIFDHNRPKHPHTAADFPEVFTPDAPVSFRVDSRNSLIASFSFAEMSDCLDRASMGNFHHSRARLVRLYQTHWLENSQNTNLKTGEWTRKEISSVHHRDYKRLYKLFKTLPFPL